MGKEGGEAGGQAIASLLLFVEPDPALGMIDLAVSAPAILSYPACIHTFHFPLPHPLPTAHCTHCACVASQHTCPFTTTLYMHMPAFVLAFATTALPLFHAFYMLLPSFYTLHTHTFLLLLPLFLLLLLYLHACIYLPHVCLPATCAALCLLPQQGPGEETPIMGGGGGERGMDGIWEEEEE